MATKKVARKAYKKQEYKIVKIKEENIPSIIMTITKAKKKFKKYIDLSNPNIDKFGTPDSIVDRLEKYKSIKVPVYVYDNMVMFRNDLIKAGYDNWLPQIKRAMRHRINPVTGKLVSSRFITMGDIINLAFVQLKIELNKDGGVSLANKMMSIINK